MRLNSSLQKWLHPFENLVYPRVCLTCGTAVLQQGQFLCTRCLQDRFTPANPAYKDYPNQEIVPDGIRFRHALWQFDSGGILQDLLHQLKYQGLEELGRALGRQLGHDALNHPAFKEISPKDNAVLLPVPLHRLKRWKRGYNQARLVAEGIGAVTGLSVLQTGTVSRIRYTRSQTGFTMEQRLKNMDQAFEVSRPGQLTGKVIIMVDDVFTTGATTFELARTLNMVDIPGAGILTIAQA